MKLNEIMRGPNSCKCSKRVGRGIGSGLGKTCGRGHKGQKSRAGGYHKVGFEGGQMPLQRRLPKKGFVGFSKKNLAVLKLSDLNVLESEKINVTVLKKMGLCSKTTKNVKIIDSGILSKKVVLEGIKASHSVRKKIIENGGDIIN